MTSAHSGAGWYPARRLPTGAFSRFISSPHLDSPPAVPACQPHSSAAGIWVPSLPNMCTHTQPKQSQASPRSGAGWHPARRLPTGALSQFIKSPHLDSPPHRPPAVPGVNPHSSASGIWASSSPNICTHTQPKQSQASPCSGAGWYRARRLPTGALSHFIKSPHVDSRPAVPACKPHSSAAGIWPSSLPNICTHTQPKQSQASPCSGAGWYPARRLPTGAFSRFINPPHLDSPRAVPACKPHSSAAGMWASSSPNICTHTQPKQSQASPRRGAGWHPARRLPTGAFSRFISSPHLDSLPAVPGCKLPSSAGIEVYRVSRRAAPRSPEECR